MVLATLWRAFGSPQQLFMVLLVSAAVLIAVEFRNIPARLRNTSLGLFALSILLLPFARAPLDAIQRGVFVSGLLLSLMAGVMLLARCALDSAQVKTVGAHLRSLRPSRRYLSFNLASQLFSGLLGLAGANILLIMAAPEQEPKSPLRTTTIIAVTRGFSAAAFWSPVFGNMAILLALYPSLSWIEVFPLGAGLALLTLMIGACTTGLSKDEAAAASASAGPTGGLVAAAAPVLAVMFGFLGIVLAASTVLGISITAGIVLVAPLVALLLNIAQSEPGVRVAMGVQRLEQAARLQFPRLASEVILFTAAGCAGSIMASAFPLQWVEGIGQALGVSPFFGVGFLMLTLVALALAGIHPVLTAFFLASTFTPEVLDLPALPHMLSILSAWGLCASVTPYSVLTITASRYSGTSLYHISLGKNGLFALIAGALIWLALGLVALS